MNAAVEIRSAQQADFEPLCELYCHSVRCNPHGFIQDLAFHGCLREKVKRWREAGGDMLVARLDGEIAGLGGLAPHSLRRAELCKLHVGSGHQGRGIGRLLASSLIAHAENNGFSEIELHVTASQHAALSLYRKLGFQETRRAMYRTVVFNAEAAFDTIYMQMQLQPAHPAVQTRRIGVYAPQP